ncbi:MAG TPA: C40 family peptidase [Nocardioidaceae bacterium]|nr:C40 family peptidase [Nocardioidaceae bacterium]
MTWSAPRLRATYPRTFHPASQELFITAAASQLGKPYVWDGGDFNGPTGGWIRLPHYSGDQIHAGTGIPWTLMRPGDLIFFSYPGAGRPHHVAIYVGGDRILHAPRTGDVVRYGTIGEFAGEVITIRRLH